MRNVAALGRLALAAPIPMPDAYEAAIRIVLGEHADEAESIPPDLTRGTLDIPSRQTRVVADQDRWTIRCESRESPLDFVDSLTSDFSQMWEIFVDTAVESVVFHSIWIDPVETTWVELVDQFRRAFTADFGLIREAVDLMQAYTFAGNAQATTGPMQPEQLRRDYLVFGDDSVVPPQFLFAHVHYEAPVGGSLTPDSLRNILTRGVLYGQDVADDLGAQFLKGRSA